MQNKLPINRLIVIDDDELTREFLAIQIAAQGYRVEVTDSGDAAVTLLQQHSGPFPDAILTDLQMPGTSGPELAQQLRSIAGTAGSPETILIAMSATVPRQSLAGIYDGFLLKPFTMAQLETALQSISMAEKIDEIPPSEPSTASSAVCLDEAVHQHLIAAIPTAQLQELYAMFLEDVGKRIAAMRVAAGTGYDATYRKEAHAIKGGAGIVGAAELNRLAAAAEERGIDPANYVASLDELLMACGRLRSILVAPQIGSSS